MNDLPQRPRFYLHRSRRFWGGLAILLLLIGWWVTSIRTVSRISYNKDYWFSDHLMSQASYEPGGPDSFRTHFYGLSLEEGCVVLSFGTHEEPSAPGRSMPGYWDGTYWSTGQITRQPIRFRPTRIPKGKDYYDVDSLYLPIWPLIALWSIFWPLWIRRGDKLEEKRFLNPPQPHDP